ncbi:MAG: extracellular solute-binding protein [Burkholderiaceae bacterium]
MMNSSFSIRNRVFLGATALLLAASLVLVVFLHDYARRAADRAFDRLLAASALSISGAVQIEDNRVAVELPFASLAMLSGSERVFYSVRNAQGALVTGYGDLDAGLPLAQSANATFNDASYHDDDIRISTVGRLVTVNQQVGWVTIRVAETRGARQELAAEILKRSALPLLVMAAVALALLWFGITRAFAPLRLIETELRHRSPDALEPLLSPVPREVRRLVDALNGFIQRLRIMLDTLNNLIADAAHQVRTPLASLRAQAEVALEETDAQRLRERLERIHLNATRASLLVNQLLMDATISHRIESRGKASVGLAEIVNETRQRIGPMDAGRLRISIAPGVRRARIDGDRVALREMLRNVVDNALRYATGDVEILAEGAPGNRLSLTVADRGPGIAENEKALVLERFGRGSGTESMPGSGLGLSIVKAAVEGHGGTLSLRNRPGGGLLVCITLALSNPGGQPSATLMGLCAAGMLALACLLAPYQAAHAQDADDSHTVVTRYPALQKEKATLTVAGPTDTPAFSALADGFQQSHPDIALVYLEIGSRQVYDQAAAGKLTQVDVLISSAVDLQVRLANDGHALRHESNYTRQLPSWAIWRSEVFGFTFEPIVMVYNPRRFTPATAPHSRPALLRLLDQEGASLHGRIGTYDITASSLGHLLANQDEMISSNFWGLTNEFGQVGVQLESNTRSILDKVENGELDLGYNVLGSYALARQAKGHKLGIVIPDDYLLVLSRAALIMRHTAHPELAGVFIDWLLSPAGQSVVDKQAALGAIMTKHSAKGYPADPSALSPSMVQPIALNPALLVGLDQQRYNRFLQNWTRLVTDTPEKPSVTGR